ncbi:MAG TPA: hypothetical protein VNU46_01475 [Gemmatimonadaceae bacterium]|jgi:hypothetical protein|nr:hypothetical protein [Gemmatimonadaceae bacterium]
MPSNTPQTPPSAAADASVLLQGVLPDFLNVVQAVAEGKPDTAESAQTLIKQLESHIGEEDEESQAVWTAAAKLAQRVFIERPGPLPLIDATQEFEEHEGAGWQVLCALCYLGASADSGTPPRLAAAFHMTVAEFLFNETHENPELYEGIILPWFVSYWTRVFADARFRFQTPRMIETEMKTAIESDPQVRLQRLLGAVGFGLDIALPDEGKEWFKA